MHHAPREFHRVSRSFPDPKVRFAIYLYTTCTDLTIGYPLLGSVPDVPEKNGFIKFADWGKEYGPIYQVNLAGTNHVWISSDNIAKDLLAKKGSIYSDRPHIPGLIDDNRTSAQYLPLLSKNGEYISNYQDHLLMLSRGMDTTEEVRERNHARVRKGAFPSVSRDRSKAHACGTAR